MHHPFGKILAAGDNQEPRHEDSNDSQSRRAHLKQVLQLGVGAVAVGMAGTAMGQITTQAIGEEGGGATTLAIGEEGGPGIAPRPGITKAGPGHPEHGGRINPYYSVQQAQKLLEKNKWSEAAPHLDKARKMFGNQKQMKDKLDKLAEKLKAQATEALGKADKQAKADDLVPALDTYRQADRLNNSYGLKDRASKAIEKLEEHELYPVALAKVKKLEADRNKNKPSTRARGEEGGGPSTRRAGEEGATTKALGEEGGKTTLRVGEEGGGRITTQAIGEEGGQRPKPVPRENIEVTTDALGEEG